MLELVRHEGVYEWLRLPDAVLPSRDHCIEQFGPTDTRSNMEKNRAGDELFVASDHRVFDERPSLSIVIGPVLAWLIPK
jgi:hypothetical protein